MQWASQVVLTVKNVPANAGDTRDKGSIPGSERSPGEGHGNPLQHSCLENPMDRGAWRVTIHRGTKSRPWLKWHMHTRCKIWFIGKIGHVRKISSFVALVAFQVPSGCMWLVAAVAPLWQPGPRALFGTAEGSIGQHGSDGRSKYWTHSCTIIMRIVLRATYFS